MTETQKSAPPGINGVLETCLYVTDVARSSGFYTRVFGFVAMTENDRFAALDTGRGKVLILFKRGTTLTPARAGTGFIPPHGGNGAQHFAFGIPESTYSDWNRHLRAEGVAIESEVAWPHGGRSLYFRDPDGHLGELATPGLWPNY
jgi:catechol 2,3-dioxygenase-like lactoylglutathione lyase family enzyme